MSRSYLRHPLLNNPVKWLRGVDKKHSSDLYISNSYKTEQLTQNPFVTALMETRLDVSKLRFPLGNMVQIIVTRNDGNNEKSKYKLSPVLQKPASGQNPASYVINSRAYTKILSRKNIKPIPLKYKHRSPLLIGSIMMEDLGAEVENLYRSQVIHLLKERDQICGEIEAKSGILLMKGRMGLLKWTEDSLPICELDLVEEPTVLSFKNDYELIATILKLIQFDQ